MLMRIAIPQLRPAISSTALHCSLRPLTSTNFLYLHNHGFFACLNASRSSPRYIGHNPPMRMLK